MAKFIATCAKGLEYLLKDEISALGAQSVHEKLGQVQFECELERVYHILMWSRLASRILMPLHDFEAKDEKQLYDGVSQIDWPMHLAEGATLAVSAQTYRSKLHHTQFIAQRVKDAIVDLMREEGLRRPDIDLQQPDLRIHCRIRRDRAQVSIDLSGDGLHRRGYRQQAGPAPIRENLAAALIARSGWWYPGMPAENVGAEFGGHFYDPMCGSGTFLIEAAAMAYDRAPGLGRHRVGISGWLGFREDLWQEECLAAEKRFAEALKANTQRISGSDINPRAVRNAQMNVGLAGFEELIKVDISAIDQLSQKSWPSSGVLICNPPYSERLGEQEQVLRLYQQLGQVLKSCFSGWRAAVLSPKKAFGHALGIRAAKIYRFNNGTIPCELLVLDIDAKNFVHRVREDLVEKDFEQHLSPGGQALCQRIRKNIKRLKRFVQQNQLQAYRIYDADLPEYNAAIDVFKDHLLIQEYQAPANIDLKKVQRRLAELKRVAAGVFEIPQNQVIVKTRQRQKGNWQYQATTEVEEKRLTIEEFGRKFYVELQGHLDVGLFIDHRLTRKHIATMAKGKGFLNLFCYTASASVYAATAGAKSTTNVDLSNTYLNWARQNYRLNGIKLNENHQFIRQDVMQWLSEAVENKLQFDIIFVDPPTFSNSKKTERDFDVQRSHVELLTLCCKLLAPQGQILFSNNYRKFQMQFQSQEFPVKEITSITTSDDFKRRPLHRCWLIGQD